MRNQSNKEFVNFKTVYKGTEIKFMPAVDLVV